jgi:hypothetical protein
MVVIQEIGIIFLWWLLIGSSKVISEIKNGLVTDREKGNYLNRIRRSISRWVANQRTVSEKEGE